jgi:3-oxoacyl-[acyl-carrier-protein] synthase I
MKELAITAANCITAVGHNGPITAAAVRAGISRFSENKDYSDSHGNPITVARIRGIEDGRDATVRMADIAALCLKNLLTDYFRQGTQRPSQIQLFLGAASEERSGPRYDISCRDQVLRVMGKWAYKADLQIIPQGNASLPYSISLAGQLIKSNPTTLCIIGGIDSLIRDSTLNWFEQTGRLKSISYGRQQGLIAGEAVGFMVIEDPARARQANMPILARIAGLGLAEEQMSRAANATSRGSGLTDACRSALAGGKDKEICAVFGDLNGENPRALEWSMTESRCFKSRNQLRQLWSPANCYGDIGATSGAVLTTIASQGFVRGWLQSPVMIFCSDDHGSCGSAGVGKGYTLAKESGVNILKSMLVRSTWKAQSTWIVWKVR